MANSGKTTPRPTPRRAGRSKAAQSKGTAQASAPETTPESTSAGTAGKAAEVTSDTSSPATGSDVEAMTGAGKPDEPRAEAGMPASDATQGRDAEVAGPNDKAATDTTDADPTDGKATATDPETRPAQGPDTKAEGQPTPGHGQDDAAAVPGTLPGAGGGVTPPVPPAPPAPPPRPGRGVLALVLGGVFAGALGFAAAWYFERGSWPFGTDGTREALDATVAAQAERLDEAETTLAALRSEIDGAAQDAGAAQDDVASLRAALDGVEAALGAGQQQTQERVDVLAESVADLAARVDTVERMPIDASEAAAAAVESYRRELAELRAEIDALRAHADTALAEAEAAREEARVRAAAAEAELAEIHAETRSAEQGERARAAMRLVRDAFASGGPYGAALEELFEIGITAPETLAAHAEDGVPSLAALEERYPPAARAALAAALRDQAGGGAMDRVTAFLRAQLGARSLTAREGDDPDAILSRAEAALHRGDLEAALDEISTLGDAGRVHMDDWVADARTRQAAEAALNDLAAEIDSL